MAKFEYTPEIVETLADAYTVRREAGELNANILTDLVRDYEGMTVRSLRTKLMTEKVYIKDTEAEKAIKTARKEAEKATKPARKTKAMVAVAILTDLGLPVKLAEDLAKAKADTLEAVFAAVRKLTAEPKAEVEPEAEEG